MMAQKTPGDFIVQQLQLLHPLLLTIGNVGNPSLLHDYYTWSFWMQESTKLLSYEVYLQMWSTDR